ncbi:polysaccharide biosynthesis tyrosine autokinase [Skermanella rosea]|uniref:GumC family protein n=1 Tax=Skermanella rosea TaxID=1817965 RepID=UPI00193168D5|nr:polysaccharide biosynthesis tyrosine autokinase [Skermanella rosea]UEM05092.1 polysaccharide biosynthesis tyrosine autokinase [Skermanella rosea]
MARNQLSAPSRELPPAREGGSVVLQIRPPEEDRIIDLSRFFSLLYRERWLILAVALLTAALAGTVLTQMAPQYSSSVLLKAESGAAKGSGLEALLPGLSGEDAGLRSEIDVMKSRTIVGRVVDRLGLVEDPEFNPVLDDPNQGALSRIWEKAYSTVVGFVRGGGPPPTEEGIRYMTVDSTVKNLSVSNDAGSLSILVGFHSSDPSKSARIANTLVEEYLAYRSAEKLNLARSATGWLGESLNQLREQVRDAEQKVQAFRAENNLVDTESGPVLVQRMSEMNAQLVQLRAERQTAEAKLQSARDAMSNGGAVAEMLDSPVIQRLRDQEGELSRQLTEQSQLGRRHPVIIELRSRLAAVQNDIQAEMRRIVSGLASNVVAFKAREVSLERAYNTLSEEIGGQGQARAQLDQLQSEARALRATFEETLAQYKAIDNPERLSAPDLSVVSAAAAPIFPSFPQKVPMLVGAAILGILLGAVAAILRDLLDRSMRSLESVEASLNVPVLGLVPRLTRSRAKNPGAYLRDRPGSTFAQGMRDIAHATQAGTATTGRNVILVTSTAPGEGKTTFCEAFAVQMARMGRKVLIIDGDLRRRATSRRQREGGIDLSTMLQRGLPYESVPRHDPRLGVDVAPSFTPTPEPDFLLNSDRMQQFVTMASHDYDLVIIDSPPIGAVHDAAILASMAAQCIYLVQWGKTPKSAALAGLRKLRRFADDIHVTSVLTQVHMRRYASYDKGIYSPYGAKYESYFRN